MGIIYCCQILLKNVQLLNSVQKHLYDLDLKVGRLLNFYFWVSTRKKFVQLLNPVQKQLI